MPALESRESRFERSDDALSDALCAVFILHTRRAAPRTFTQLHIVQRRIETLQPLDAAGVA